MNRCRPVFAALLASSTALVFSLAPATAAHAQAVQRHFPAKALRGSMVVVQPPLVAMDDRPTRFTAGARILNTDNSLVRPSSLVNQELTVNYTLDQRGQIHQVWILTAAEAKEKRPGYGTQRNFTFESQQASPAGTPAPTTN
jgi:hypothetical protein